MYKLARAYTTKYLIEQLEAMKQTLPAVADAVYLDFDGHADVTKIPMGSVVGISAFGWTYRGGYWDLMLGVSCMTIDDPNILNLVDMADWFYDAVMPGKSYEAEAGTLTFGGEPAVSPVMMSDKRPTQQIIAYGKFVIPLAADE